MTEMPQAKIVFGWTYKKQFSRMKISYYLPYVATQKLISVIVCKMQ